MSSLTHHTPVVPIKPTVMETLLLLRRRKGWTQAETARKLGVKVRTLAGWERGENQPAPIVLRTIKQFVDENS